jgi:ATP-binding cassette, subfamily B, bacterial
VTQLRDYRRSIAVLIQTGVRATPGWMALSVVLQAVTGVSNGLLPFSFGLFTNAIVRHDHSELVLAVFLASGLWAIGWSSVALALSSSSIVAQRADLYLAGRIAELVNDAPGLEHFERPDYLQELDLLTQNRRLISSAPQQLLNILMQLIRTGVMVGIVATVNPWFLLLPIAGIAPFLADSFSARYRQRSDNALSEDARLANAFFERAATAGPAKELRLFGLGPELLQRHHDLTERIITRTSRAGFVAMGVGAAGWFVFAGGFVAATVSTVIRAVHGEASIGDVVMVVALVQGIQLNLGALTASAGQLLMSRRTALRYIWLENHTRQSLRPVGTGDIPVPSRISDGIDFDAVSFTYPGTDEPVLRDVSLRLPAGAAVAIVGENGAGKTTLVKLLSRMYAPTTGVIRVDGNDLADFDVVEWRERLTATFQDFARYELRAGSTVGVGDLPRHEDDAAVRDALERAGAVDVLDRLDAGLDTQLGRSFVTGRELSGGEWQKFALGRGRMRADPLLLVLDEPTSSLDAPTEHALFERYIAAARATAATAGTITILVSHRFSTVRIADLIVVVADGSITEFGTHAELMALGGTYAELFRLQSAAYA